MAVNAVQVNIVSSVDDFLQLVLQVVGDVKKGEPVGNILADALPALEVALKNLGDLSGDLANRSALENTLALKLAQFVQVFSA